MSKMKPEDFIHGEYMKKRRCNELLTSIELGYAKRRVN